MPYLRSICRRSNNSRRSKCRIFGASVAGAIVAEQMSAEQMSPEQLSAEQLSAEQMSPEQCLGAFVAEHLLHFSSNCQRSICRRSICPVTVQSMYKILLLLCIILSGSKLCLKEMWKITRIQAKVAFSSKPINYNEMSYLFAYLFFFLGGGGWRSF